MHLEIPPESLSSIFQKYTSLERVTIENSFSLHYIPTDINRCKQLTFLSLARCPWIDDISFLQGIQYLLLPFRFVFLSQLYNNQFPYDFVLGCVSLQTLDLQETGVNCSIVPVLLGNHVSSCLFQRYIYIIYIIKYLSAIYYI